MSPSQHPPGRSLALRIGRWLGGIALALLLIVTLALTAVFSFEQSTLRPLAERLVESATGRVLSIDGELDLVAGRVIILKVGGIRLANADWGKPQPMLSVERVEISLDLLRVVTGTPAADNLVIDGAQLLFEHNWQGHSNWDMGPGQVSAPVSPQPEARDDEPAIRVLPVIRSTLNNIDVTVIDAALAAPLELHFGSITHQADQDDAVQARIDGQVKGRPFNLEARVRPVSQLLAAGAVQVGLKAASRSVQIDLEGEVDKLSTPTQVSAHVSLAATDIAQVLATLGLPPLAKGATELKASLLPSDGQHTLDLYAAILGLKLDAQARLQSLTSIDGATATLSANGLDLASVAKLAGLDGLPAQSFSLSSSVALAGTQLTLGETRFESGSIQLDAQGSMAQFPELANSNLQLRLVGRNYVELVALTGLTDLARLRPAPFDVKAELEYSERHQQRFNAELTLADVQGNFNGTLSGTSDLVGSELDYKLSGRNDALLQQVLGKPTRIEGGYTLEGKVTRTTSGFDIQPADLALGPNRLQVSGKLGNQPLLADTELSLRFTGPDLDKLAAIAGYQGFLPAGHADIVTTTAMKGHRLRIDTLDAQLGRNRLQASGEVNIKDALSGSSLKLTMSGDDIADVVPPAYHEFVEAGQSFQMTSQLATARQKLTIDAMRARLGKVNLQASGSLSPLQPLTDTALTFELDGPDLAAFVPDNLVPYEFPADAFSVGGGVALGAEGLTLDGIEATIGKNLLEVSGIIPLDTPTDGLELALSASGPDLAGIVPIDPEQLDVTDLAFDLAANLQLREGVMALRELDFSTQRGELSGQLSVSLENPRQLGQFDLRARGDNLDEFVPTTPEYSPAAVPFDLNARGNWDLDTLHIDQGELQFGSASIVASGEVNLDPDAVASQMTLSARGESLADLGQLKDVVFPDEPFSIDASLAGDASRLTIPELKIRLGASNLHGSLEFDLADKPSIAVQLDSDLLDIAALLPPPEESPADEEPPEPAANDGRVIPNIEVPVDQLNAINLETRINVGELRLPLNILHRIEIDSSLKDGHLKVRQLKATATEGQIRARFEAIADGERISTRGELEGKEIILGKSESDDTAISLPKQDLYLGFETQGATLHELAANLDGLAHLTGGSGRLQNSLALSLFGSFFTELLSAINPFVTKEPYTNISCYAAFTEITDGVAIIKPGAVMQTDKLNMFAQGQIDLNTEAIALRFDTSARSGIGISVADFVNPFVGVSGTLAKPRLGVDPENAMFQGGFAYATGGMSIVAKSLYNRWFGTKDPCADLQLQAEELQQEKQEAAQRGADGATK